MIKREVAFFCLSEILNTSLDTESYFVPPTFLKVSDSGIIPGNSSFSFRAEVRDFLFRVRNILFQVRDFLFG